LNRRAIVVGRFRSFRAGGPFPLADSVNGRDRRFFNEIPAALRDSPIGSIQKVFKQNFSIEFTQLPS
jgi:hypothetical protein